MIRISTIQVLMKNPTLWLTFISLLLLGGSQSTVANFVEITIDGDMGDWGRIPNLLNDSDPDLPVMNLIAAQLFNSSAFLFIRLTYQDAYEYQLLWGNVTVQNQYEDVFVLLAFVSSGERLGYSSVFYGTNLDSPYNDPEIDNYTSYFEYSAVAEDYKSIEFKIPLQDINSGDNQSLSRLDFVFWHYDIFRVPVSGYISYFPGKNQSLLPQPTTTGNEDTDFISTELLNFNTPIVLLFILVLCNKSIRKYRIL